MYHTIYHTSEVPLVAVLDQQEVTYGLFVAGGIANEEEQYDIHSVLDFGDSQACCIVPALRHLGIHRIRGSDPNEFQTGTTSCCFYNYFNSPCKRWISRCRTSEHRMSERQISEHRNSEHRVNECRKKSPQPSNPPTGVKLLNVENHYVPARF